MLNSNQIIIKLIWRFFIGIFCALFIFMAEFTAPVRIYAQQAVSPVTAINEDAAKADIKVKSLRGNLSVLTGSGGNITVLTGTGGKLMVDGGIALSRVKIQAALDGISSAPLKYLINTHWHWNHTDSNEWLQAQGAIIITQENTLTETTRVEDWNFTFQPVPADALPTVCRYANNFLKIRICSGDPGGGSNHYYSHDYLIPVPVEKALEAGKAVEYFKNNTALNTANLLRVTPPETITGLFGETNF